MQNIQKSKCCAAQHSQCSCKLWRVSGAELEHSFSKAKARSMQSPTWMGDCNVLRFAPHPEIFPESNSMPSLQSPLDETAN